MINREFKLEGAKDEGDTRVIRQTMSIPQVRSSSIPERHVVDLVGNGLRDQNIRECEEGFTDETFESPKA